MFLSIIFHLLIKEVLGTTETAKMLLTISPKKNNSNNLPVSTLPYKTVTHGLIL